MRIVGRAVGLPFGAGLSKDARRVTRPWPATSTKHLTKGSRSPSRVPDLADASAINDWYPGYVHAFVAGHAKELAAKYVAAPALFMVTNADGSYVEFSATDEDAVAALYTGMHQQLVDSGYASANMEPLLIEELTPHTFSLTTSGIRYKADGSELSRIGSVTYLVKRVPDLESPFRIACTVGKMLLPRC